MILPIVRYGNPVLRQKGAEVRDITDAIRQLASDMLETMREAHGIGLAAQQVGHAIQLTVLDVRGSEHPSQLLIGARETPVESVMPMILVNPSITRHEGHVTGGEGCLSFPGISGEVPRASTVHVRATQLDGSPLNLTATGLLARCLQHELDHLNGVLFTDRMTPEILAPLEEEIRALEKETRVQLKKGGRKPRSR